MADRERRRHERIKIDKTVTIRDGVAEHRGRVLDISSSGAAVSMNKSDLHLEDDQDLELELEEIGVLSGNVVRALDDGFAMSFDLDDESEDRLISEITGYQTGSFTE